MNMNTIINRVSIFCIIIFLTTSCGIFKNNKLPKAGKSDMFNEKIEELKIEKSLKAIDEKIYLKKYKEALAGLNDLKKDYPYNKTILGKIDFVTSCVFDEKKAEFLKTKPTRNVVELNFGIASSPNQFVDNNQFKINNQEYLLDDLFSSFQLGIYRKFHIRDRNNRLTSAKFKYSQAGIRIGFINPNSGIYNIKGDSSINFSTKIATVSGSLIARRFFMINVGLASFQDTNGLNFMNNNLGFGEIGVRIPFGPIHFTSDIATYSDFNRTYKVFFRFGMSINIGFNKKFSDADERFLKTQISNQNF